MSIDAGRAGGRTRPDEPSTQPLDDGPDQQASVGDPAGAPAAPIVDRRAAFAAGVPKMPRRVIYGSIAAILVLGLGISLVDRLATSSSSSKPVRVATTPGPSVPVPPQNATQLHAPLPAFLGLKTLHRSAPVFSLTDAASGSTVTLGDLRHHVVVLTFANAACNDICPVLASELVQADALLGKSAASVTLVTINSDPLDTAPSATVPIARRTGLGALTNWRFLTGPVDHLNKVWVHYGISITADRANGVASHNNFLYFIAPDGRLAWRATPFADESTSGTYSLSSAEIARFAQGVAHYAGKLAGST